ncbi:DUF1145 domain-containing protein [Pseudomonas sp. ZM23]|uniref:DUF1145 domain-containing protein n=1 Tax=Pseudomonas triclosanedens TaxID=2961893 RepID=A0ABY7A4D1_9PSED|nr:DUF1145 domain-containing protein [Pseudomonas triclosanedens]MCP8464529.1 DUF1145 domain-containing protein [Pseudomonas triclosanedens]MCP8473562.1 DUF1145 domain-containing protein [Pseudomonas triclosanedens]MCP8478313.1 DUF1145 domain-containing protein [Pseudomonas triclosanedens]WAI50988.1 DUF1145 domain-containing protein [Pseudomonas triclosanedens]
MSELLSFAKGALAMFWLAAVLNLVYPFGELHRPLLWLSGAIVLVHVGEVALLARRRSLVDQIQVLLFGVLHLQGRRMRRLETVNG